MPILIIEANSGISGDMFVAAAAALAGCEAEVLLLPAKLGLAGVTCRFQDVQRSSLRGRKFDVLVDGAPAEAAAVPAQPHAHGHTHPHAHGPAHDHGHAHPHEHGHGHAHEHAGHEEKSEPHEHRLLSSIGTMIKAAGLEPRVCDRALRLFERLGAVEAEAHGIPIEAVHFHEVGAVDSIVDLVAASLCIERLNVNSSVVTTICVGSGTVWTAHGRLPVPAPATERLLQGMPTIPGELPGEWTTPTGAAILAELQPAFSIPVSVTRASAFGAGGTDPAQRANLLRLRLADTVAAPASAAGVLQDEVVVLTTNIDDSSGELLGADLIDRLLKAGAKDAVLHPLVMKKGRPGQQLEVMAAPARAEALAQLILTHTSTIGVRLQPMRRLLLRREAGTVMTPYGDLAVKRVHLPDGTVRITPEYESCRELAERAGVPVQTVYRAAGKVI